MPVYFIHSIPAWRRCRREAFWMRFKPHIYGYILTNFLSQSYGLPAPTTFCGRIQTARQILQVAVWSIRPMR